MKKILACTFWLVAATMVAVSAHAAGEEINWQVVSSGGGAGSSTNYKLNGTIGQTATGFGNSTSYKLNSGYWQDFASGPTTCCIPPIRGEIDGIGLINILDVNRLVSWLFAAGTPPVCDVEANVDGIGIANILDVNRLVSYLFAAGAPPASCP